MIQDWQYYLAVTAGAALMPLMFLLGRYYERELQKKAKQ